MRKFALLGALLLTSASLSVPLSQTALAISCEGQIGCPIPKPQPPKQQRNHHRSAAQTTPVLGLSAVASHRLPR